MNGSGERLADAMARIKAETSLRDYCADHLNRIGRTWECPACHSGTGPNRSPAFSILSDGGHWKCYSCEAGGDIFDLAGILAGTDDRAAQAQAVADWAHSGGWNATEPGEASRRDDLTATRDVPEPQAAPIPAPPGRSAR